MEYLQHPKNTNHGRISFLGLLILLVGLLWNPAPLSAQANAEAEAIFQAGTVGGTYGYRVRRIGANSASFSQNSNFVFYPASCIKIFEHFYAMALVQNGTWTLNKSTDPCSASQNCSDAANSGNCTTNIQSLELTLEQMMRSSSNAATNSVQQEVGQQVNPMSATPAALGRSTMNNWGGAVLGMTSTNLNTKFGCVGACGTNPNTATLRDLERLYTVLAGNSILDNAHRIQLKDLMQNETDNYFNTVVNEEAASTGRNAILPSFYSKLYYIYKGGSWTCGNGDIYITLGGLIQLPTYSGAYKRLYTFGGYVDGVSSYNGGTVKAGVVESLRPAIRAALLTWPGPFAPADGFAVASNEGSNLLGLYGTTPAAKDLKLMIRALDNAEAWATIWDDSHKVKKPVDEGEEAIMAAQAAAQNIYDPGLDSIILWTTSASLELVKDAQALMVATGDGSTFGIVCQQVSQYIENAETYLAAGAFLAAMDQLQLAAALTEQNIDWNFNGPRDWDSSVGFAPVRGSRKASEGSAPLGVTVWPNPVQDEMNIRVELAASGKVAVEIFDLQGRKLYAETLDGNASFAGFHLDTQELPTGVLMVKISTDNQVAIEKIIHQN